MAQQTATVAYVRVELVTLDSSKAADQLYTTAKRWFVDTFKDSKAVIEFDDAATHTIVGNGSFTYEPTIFLGSGTRRGSMRYTIEVSCKDGRYRVKLSNYTHIATAGLGAILSDSTVCSGATGQGYGTPGKPTAYLKRVCKEEALPMIQDNETKLLASLKAAMLKPAGPSDW